jgi:hypothetical protein
MVLATIKELQKIEMIRLLDFYRLDHAVTTKQKSILKSVWSKCKTRKRKGERLVEG